MDLNIALINIPMPYVRMLQSFLLDGWPNEDRYTLTQIEQSFDEEANWLEMDWTLFSGVVIDAGKESQKQIQQLQMRGDTIRRSVRRVPILYWVRESIDVASLLKFDCVFGNGRTSAWEIVEWLSKCRATTHRSTITSPRVEALSSQYSDRLTIPCSNVRQCI